MWWRFWKNSWSWRVSRMYFRWYLSLAWIKFKIMKEEVFTTVNLPMGGSATIFEGKGRHYFSAMLKAKGEGSLMMKFMIMEIVQIDDKKISEEQIDEMHLRDITYLASVIGLMMSDDFAGF